MVNPFATIGELGAALRTKQISSLELTRFYLARLEKYGTKLGAVVTITRERAEAEARDADADIAAGKMQNRPLLGIPYGVKDLLATKGIPTTWGAEPLRNQVFDYDATVVKRLTTAGAVLCAKLAMVELAGGFGYNNADASFTGPGRTPWNTDFWSGGSSSGPGAAVGAGLVPFAIGSETSGSILTPSAFSGVTGLRPTYGAVSRHGAMAISWTLDKLGPMCRNAGDCNTVLHAISGEDPDDPTTMNIYVSGRATFIANSMMLDHPRKLRIGIVKGSHEKVQKEVRENFFKSVEVLKKQGHTIVEDLAWPDLPMGVCVGTIVDAEGASAFEDFLRSGKGKQLRAVADRTGGYGAAATLAVDYLRAQRIRAKVRKEILAMFDKLDLIAGPTRSSVAYPIGKDFDQAYPGVSGGPSLIGGMNLVGAPAISLPNGFGENGLPTAMQLIAAPANEIALLNAAVNYQAATAEHTKMPAGFAS
jgi:aspartyl-tRNA(Asn)/glutamyl-tRNA(Gln) amidotransferase subunit A